MTTSTPDKERTGTFATVEQVAIYLQLSRSKIYQLMEAGELAFAKFGSSRRIRWEDVDAYVKRSMFNV